MDVRRRETLVSYLFKSVPTHTVYTLSRSLSLKVCTVIIRMIMTGDDEKRHKKGEKEEARCEIQQFWMNK